MPNTLGFRVSILLIICWMLGMGHPSSPPVVEFNRKKSRVKRHFWDSPSGVGLSTRWTWLHSVAYDSWITPSSKSALNLLPYLPLLLFRMLSRWCTITWKCTYLHLPHSSRFKRIHQWILEPMPSVWFEAVVILWRWSETSVVLGSHPSRQVSLHRKEQVPSSSIGHSETALKLECLMLQFVPQSPSAVRSVCFFDMLVEIYL